MKSSGWRGDDLEFRERLGWEILEVHAHDRLRAATDRGGQHMPIIRIGK
jgi:hypothetical protein